MKAKKARDFWKLQAAGNDFILYFQTLPKSNKALKKSIVEACALHTGIGADGVIYVQHQKGEWSWLFFNADGSETSLCGNAARALALWISKVGRGMLLGRVKNSGLIEWKSALGLFQARPKAAGSNFEVTWTLKKSALIPIGDDLRDLLWQLNERGLAGTYLYDVGVPHLVLLGHESWNETDRMTCNAVFRSHPSLGLEGANVTWVELPTLKTVTFERGVERETLACGSGALAAFLALKAYRADQKQNLSKVSLKFPGGNLEVRQDRQGQIWLGGPSSIVFKGSV